MNNINLILKQISEVQNSSYLILRTEILEHEKTFFKARLYIKKELYIQVYRNDKYRTTNFVLVLYGERIYGRDELRGKWHRHPENDPQTHDTTPAGTIPSNFKDFFEEIKPIIHKMKLL